ncbi:MAG: EthD domain-containing protein [Actinobacteria bacterium]|nr:EthD domain-containing protein [Actinomycetota bacterium]
MIKLVAFLKRKPGMSADDFYDHWFNQHAPLIASTPELAQHIVRYEQLALDTGTDGYDGITIQWMESRASFEAFVAEPKYLELIYPDEGRFLDRDGIVWMISAEPRVVIDGPTS